MWLKATSSLNRLMFYGLQNVQSKSENIARCSVLSLLSKPAISFSGGYPCSSIIGNSAQYFQLQQQRHYAARKGTRTRKEKKKVKKEEVKRVFIFKQLKKQADMVYQVQRPVDDSKDIEAVDDVYFHDKFKQKAYPFAEAVQNHKETHHPCMYNVPDAALILRLDIDLVYPNRPNKFQDGWRSVIEMKEPFLLVGMTLPTVLAFCPSNETEMMEEALRAGADMAGSNEIIRMIQEGHTDPNEYEYIVCHPSMVTDLTAIRGLIKKKFPSVKAKTVNQDVAGAVKALKSGIKVHVNKNDREPDFGYLETAIGKLDMDTKDLESNFVAVLSDAASKRVASKAPEDFIIKASLTSPFTSEVFKIDIASYLQTIKEQKKVTKKAEVVSEKDEEDPTQENVAASQAQ